MAIGESATGNRSADANAIKRQRFASDHRMTGRGEGACVARERVAGGGPKNSFGLGH
jgi:hypothetical protein